MIGVAQLQTAFRDPVTKESLPEDVFGFNFLDFQQGLQVEDQSGTAAIRKNLPHLCNGRLTMADDGLLPFTTADQTAKTTLYWIPFQGNEISLYDSARWRLIYAPLDNPNPTLLKLTDTGQTGTVTNGSPVLEVGDSAAQLVPGMEITGDGGGIPGGTTILTVDSATQITMSADGTADQTETVTFKCPANKNYDVFALYTAANPLWATAGNLRLGNAWTNDTTRADALGTQDGVIVNNADINSGQYIVMDAKAARYLGTVRTTATAGQTEDSVLRRFLWNLSHPLPKHLRAIDTANSWNYHTNTWRQANANTANKVEFVIGLEHQIVQAVVLHITQATVTVQSCAGGIGLDSTTANSAQVLGAQAAINATGDAQQQLARWHGFPGLGYHYLAWLEIGGGTTTQTWYGDAGGPWQSGLLAWGHF